MTVAPSNLSLWTSAPVSPGRIVLGMGLSLFTSITIFGNFLVIYAVVRQRYLRTITNYFIVSLACADLLMGLAVMPMAVYREVTGPGWPWPFDRNVCDLWHALDVLSSTASIINLCLIAVERYWATENPITYPTKMTKRRCILMIAAGWVCSSAISFPAIIWWRHSDPQPKPGVCEFTTDATYLFLSSVVSFYAPLIVMVVVYYRIYRTATNLIRSFNAGAKIIYRNSGGVRGAGGDVMVLRIHRGRHPSPLPCRHPLAEDPDDRSNSTSPVRRSFFRKSRKEPRNSALGATPEAGDQAGLCPSANRTITRKLRKFAVGRRLIKFNREQKAAKTLGIVMGIFIACWLPFFTCNIIVVARPSLVPGVLWGVVTWLGYINSSINPIIYAHSMRDFRRAFLKLLCACYLRRLRHQRGLGLRSNCNWNSNTYASPSSSCRRRLLGVSPPPPMREASVKRPPSPPSVQTTPLRTLQGRAESPALAAHADAAFNGYLTPTYCPSKDSDEEMKEEDLRESLMSV